MKENYTKYSPGFQEKDSMRDKAKKMFGKTMNASELKVRTSPSAPSRTKTRLYAKGGAVRSERTITMANHLKKGRCYNDGGDVEDVTARRGGKIGARKACRHELSMQAAPRRPLRGKPPANPLRGPKVAGRDIVPKGHKRRRYESGGFVADEPMDAARMGSPGPIAPVAQAAPAPGPSRMQQALGMARQYAPKAQSFLNSNAPRLGRAFGQARDFANRMAPRAQQAFGIAKRYAPQAQDFISRFSPSLGQKFGKFRSMVGLKKGGRATQGYAMGGVGKIRHGQSTKSGRPVVRKPRGR